MPISGIPESDFPNTTIRSAPEAGPRASDSAGPRVDLAQLRTFVAVAEEQHLTRAADRLHISQSAASAHVRAVEESLGARLFVRTNRNLELTRDGQLLLEQARQLLHEAARLQSFARELKGETKGTLVVGASSEPSSTRIGAVVAALRARHPLVTVDLRARPSTSTRQALRTGELDVGMHLGHSIDPGFVYHRLSTVRFRIVGPVAWASRIHAADWAALARLPWITPSTSSSAYTAVMDQLFRDRGLEPNSVVCFDNIVLARALLDSGIGMMLMREEFALQGERDGYLAISPLGQAELGFFVSHLAGREADPLVKAFVEAAGAVWPEMTRAERAPASTAIKS